MTSLEVRAEPWTQGMWSPQENGWATQTVTSRVEFLLDGRSLSELNPVDAKPEPVSVFEVVDATEAVKIMLGEAILPNDFIPDGRIPLLTCECGDPSDGSLTVRFSRTGGMVVWDQWAWEHGGFGTETFPDLPECRFRHEDYTAALHDAGRLAATVGDQASSIVRVPDHIDGVWRWLAKRVRGEMACELDWLDIEVVHPPAEEWGVDLRQLVDAVAVFRDELATAKTRRRHAPIAAPSQRALTAVSRIVASPEAFRLPAETLEAVKWLHARVSQ